MSYRVGVDIGGTFTDFCVFEEATNRVHSLKVLSTPERPGAEVMEGLGQLAARHGVGAAEIAYFTHGTTVGVNTVIQRQGARLALFTTENFGDVLELARLKTPDPYDLFSKRPVPLVPKDRVMGIAERILADGSVERPLDEASVARAVERATALAVEGIVVSLLNAYRNPAHERRIKAIVEGLAPGLPVFCSSEVWPIVREYERTVTAVINGYVQPRVSAYLGSLQEALGEAGVPAEPFVTKSNGGVMGAELGKTDCVQMLLSGTASGVMGASFVARQCGIEKAMSLDIGGTSADVAFIVDGAPEFGVGERVGEFPIFIPTVSVTSIGDGGGSIAWVDNLGVLRVGPESAGAAPGPACYGQGGARATITDAFAVSGFLGSGDLGFGAVSMHLDKAEAVIGELAGRLGRNVEDTGEAVIQVGLSVMYMEVSKLISRQGADPADFAMIAFGGAGPMLACFLARELGTPEVVIPTTPGVLSALGGLVADIKNDFIKTVYLDVEEALADPLREGFAELEARAGQWLREAEASAEACRLVHSADMRYRGQSFEIETAIDAAWIRDGDMVRIRKAFHAQHQQLYEHSDAEAEVQVINLRLVVLVESPKPSFEPMALAEGEAVAERELDVYLDGNRRRVPYYRRENLAPGQRLAGPAIIAQSDCTTCVPDGFEGAIDAYGNIRLTLTAATGDSEERSK